MSEWLPIESAPKDGTPVLMQVRDIGYGYDGMYIPPMVVAWYDGSDWRFCSYDSGIYGVLDEVGSWLPLPPLRDKAE